MPSWRQRQTTYLSGYVICHGIRAFPNRDCCSQEQNTKTSKLLHNKQSPWEQSALTPTPLHAHTSWPKSQDNMCCVYKHPIKKKTLEWLPWINTMSWYRWVADPNADTVTGSQLQHIFILVAEDKTRTLSNGGKTQSIYVQGKIPRLTQFSFTQHKVETSTLHINLFFNFY